MYTILSKLLVCQLKPLDIKFPGHSADGFSPVLPWKYIWDCYGKQRKVEFGLHSLPGSLFLGIWPDWVYFLFKLHYYASLNGKWVQRWMTATGAPIFGPWPSPWSISDGLNKGGYTIAPRSHMLQCTIWASKEAFEDTQISLMYFKIVIQLCAKDT